MGKRNNAQSSNVSTSANSATVPAAAPATRATLADKIGMWEACGSQSELAPAIKALIDSYRAAEEKANSCKRKLRKLLSIEVG